MSKIKLSFAALLLALGTSTTSFGANSLHSNQIMLTNPGQNTHVGQGTVISVNEDGTFTYVDMETGEIRIATAAGLNVNISMGDLITVIYIITPSGQEVLKQIKRMN